MNSNDDTDEREKFRKRSIEVSRILRERPYDSIAELEKLGFQYVCEDENDQAEIAEEKAAKANTDPQKRLVIFFEGEAPPNDQLVSDYLEELKRDEPNYPLLRRYFRKGNKQLLALLRHGLGQHPTNPDLLNGLGFYHIFSPILKELISCYSKACEVEQEMTNYRQLAQDFYINSSDSGYEALHALDEALQQNDPKKAIVRDLIAEWDDQGIMF